MKLRYFYDPGSGVCLWAADDEARAAYGYPVSLEELPLSLEARAEGDLLLALFDSSIDWNDPAGPSPWSPQQRSDFAASSGQFFARVAAELGAGFEVKNEMPA